MKRFLCTLALLAGIAPACAQNVSIPNLPSVTIPADNDLFILEHVAGPNGQHTSRLLASDLVNYVNSRLALTGGISIEMNRALAAEGVLTTNLAAEVTRATTAEGLKAPLASPALTGTPTAPTATAGTSTTQLATTAFSTGGVATETSRAQTAEGTKITGPLTGDVTTSGAGSATTLATSGVTAGSYGSSTTVPVITIDAKGRITAASSSAAAGTGTVTNVATGAGLSGGPITATGTLAAADNLMQGRLTLASGTPVMTSGVAAATSVKYTPYTGNLVGLWNGSSFVASTFSELSVATSGLTASNVYDVFIWSNGGTVTETFGPAWTAGATAGSNTARGSGAGSTAIGRVNGVLVNTNALSGGPAAGYGTYVGTVATDGGGATVSWGLGSAAAGGGAAVLNVWNTYNRVTVSPNVNDTTASHTYVSTTYRAWDNSATNRITFVVGVLEDGVLAQAACAASSSAAAGSQTIGLGLDSASAVAAGSVAIAQQSSAAGFNANPSTSYGGLPGLGAHFLQLLEAGDGTRTATFNGATQMTYTAALRM